MFSEEPSPALRRNLAIVFANLIKNVHLAHRQPAFVELHTSTGQPRSTMPRDATSFAVTYAHQFEQRRDAIALVALVARLLRDHPVPGRDLAVEWMNACDEAFRKHEAGWRFEGGQLVRP